MYSDSTGPKNTFSLFPPKKRRLENDLNNCLIMQNAYDEEVRLDLYLFIYWGGGREGGGVPFPHSVWGRKWSSIVLYRSLIIAF